MELYLVRHGDPVDKNIDPECPLSEHGFSEINKIADYIITNKKITVSEIFHSGKTRTRQTAELIGNYITVTVRIQKADGLKPLDDTQKWVEQLNNRQNNLMIVGHLPFLSILASRLLKTDSEIQFNTGTVACLSTTSDINWNLNWTVSPSEIKQP